ncbi:MAG: FAD-binding oxidoreductase, partial [Erythrobacter sp.]|nr:FAD-binding oxidoreductase [Erythrobacter sp.]
KVIAHQGVQRPFDSVTPYYALLEFEYEGEETESVIAELLEPLMTAGTVVDAVLSQSLAQAQSLWRLREDISETISQWTPYKNDISTTISRVPGFLQAIDHIVNREYPDLEVVWFGHIGDGNLHLNILRPDALSIEAFAERCKVVSEALFTEIASMGGSVSAEHGVGLLKKPFLHYSRSEEEIAMMRGIKRVFDPDNIMNPGKVFDMEGEA